MKNIQRMWILQSKHYTGLIDAENQNIIFSCLNHRDVYSPWLLDICEQNQGRRRACSWRLKIRLESSGMVLEILKIRLENSVHIQ